MNPNNNNKNKFLFDLNNFNTPEEEEEIIVEEEVYVEPPPPVFSEDDMEAAKAVAHAQGKSEGTREERAKREQHITENLETIAKKFETLFAAELYREKQYEEESLNLALEIIHQIAPSLNERFGAQELKATIKQTLQSQSEQMEIRIDVHPDYAAEIDRYIENLWEAKDNAPKCKVVANSEIEIGGCDMSWKDGGMIRNPQKMVEDMKGALENLLVDTILSPTISPKPQKTEGNMEDTTPTDVTNAQNNGIKESDINNRQPSGEPNNE